MNKITKAKVDSINNQIRKLHSDIKDNKEAIEAIEEIGAEVDGILDVLREEESP